MSSENVNSSNKYANPSSLANANNTFGDNTNNTNINSSSTVHYPIKASPKVDKYEKLSSARVQPTSTRQLTTPQRRPTPLKHTNSINHLSRGSNNNNNNSSYNGNEDDAVGPVYKSKEPPRAQTALRREQYTTNNNIVVGEGEEKARQGPEYKTPLRPASRRVNATPTPFNSRRMQGNGPFDNISVSSLTSGSHSHTNINNNHYYEMNNSINTSNSNNNSSSNTTYNSNRHKMSRITVVVRKRPLNSNEINS